MRKLILAAFLAVSVSAAFGQTKNYKRLDQKDTARESFRVKYNDVFRINNDGSVSPKYVIQIGGVTMSQGVSFSVGTSFSGVDIASYKGHDLLIDTVKGIVILKNIFK